MNTLSERPVWAEVDLAAIRHNYVELKKLLSPKTIMCAVVKADGYGHGSAAVAREALAAGAGYIAVAILDEAGPLRASGYAGPLLILGFTPPTQAARVVRHGLTQTIYSFDQAQALSDAAKEAGTTVKVHVKVDTGMGRIGVSPDEAGDFCARVAALPNVVLEGIYTHFACADATDKTSANAQFAAFKRALSLVEAANVRIPIRHCANSAATIDLPETHLDMVRVGIASYGLWPSDEVSRERVTLKPGMRLKARVAHVKTVPAGTRISYGGTYEAAAPSVIATLPLGYADGFTRMLSGKANVVVRGQRAPVVGRICMDQCMIDVSGIDGVRVGDEVLLFGGEALPADEVAASLGTINYEIVCMVGKRVPRMYV